MTKIDVDPDVLSHEATTLSALAHDFPKTVTNTAGATGSVDVDNAVSDMTLWIQASWQALASGVENLGTNAKKAAEQYRLADKHAADDAGAGKSK